jgi:hypothetical protein
MCVPVYVLVRHADFERLQCTSICFCWRREKRGAPHCNDEEPRDGERDNNDNHNNTCFGIGRTALLNERPPSSLFVLVIVFCGIDSLPRLFTSSPFRMQ